MIRRSRLLTLVLAVLATLTGLSLVTATPADAGSRHSRSLSYVALGDSYAAGFGAGEYVNECFQSRRGYPALLDRETRASLQANATCNGATTRTVLATQVSAVTPRTQLITLTVGGNDLGFATVATTCAPGPSTACQEAISGALALLAPQSTGPSVLATRLAATYGAVATAAPRADILVTGYPILFKAPAKDQPNADVVLALNDATKALNATIKATVAATAATGVEISYVDVTAGFAGHGIGSERPYLHATGPEALHPTARGYRVYAKALSRALVYC
ncbi:MAG TPA: SGNH/GDSL hydrolase family protein [Microlunatus sp.]|jgi:lysophospholipase L1-like esterase|nr:SGNH/GDSL hydrolase family protein [Microlunatus sp.]